MASDYLLSLLLGIASGYLPDKFFNLVLKKTKLKNLVTQMYLAQGCKIVFFILLLVIIFKFVPIKPKIFIFGVIFSLIMNFIRKLLKLIYG